MNPTDPALLAAVAALTQQVTGLGSAVTMLAQKQNQQSQQQQKQPGQDRRPGSAPDAAAGGMASEGPLGKVLGLATAKVMAFIAPLVAVGTVLAQTISGFGMITTAVKVLATTLAPLLLPVFVLLAAAIVAVSDELWEGIKNVLPAWYGWIMQHGIPAFVALVGAVRAVIDWFKKLSLYGDGPAPEGRNPGDPIPREDDDPSGGSDLWHQPGQGMPLPAMPVPGVHADRIREEWKSIQDDIDKKTAEHMRQQLRHSRGEASAEDVAKAEREKQRSEANRLRYLRGFDMDPEEARRHLDRGNVPRIRNAPPQTEGGPGVAAGDAAGGAGAGIAGAIGADRRPSAAQRYGTAVRDVIQSLRMQIAPPAQMLASNSVNRQAQMDLYKQDPLERRMQERSLAALDMLLQAIPKIESNTAQKPPGLFGG